MKEIYMDSLNEEMIFIIENVGMDNFLKLCHQFQGESIYFPKMKSQELTDRNKKIKSEFNGKNTKNLALRYNISERQIKRIVSRDM